MLPSQAEPRMDGRDCGRLAPKFDFRTEKKFDTLTAARHGDDGVAEYSLSEVPLEIRGKINEQLG